MNLDDAQNAEFNAGQDLAALADDIALADADAPAPPSRFWLWVCWIFLLGYIALSLWSSLPKAGDAADVGSDVITPSHHHSAVAIGHSFQTDLQLRFAIGTYQQFLAIGQTENLDPVRELIGTPGRTGSAATRQALTVSIIDGPQAAQAFLPPEDARDRTQSWLARQLAGEDAGAPPPQFNTQAGRFAALAGSADNRDTFIQSCTSLVVILGFLSLLAIIVGGAGFILFGFFLRAISQRSATIFIPPAAGAAAHRQAWLIAFCTYFSTYIAFGLLLSLILPDAYRMHAAWLFIGLLPLPFIVLRKAGLPPIAVAVGAGMHPGRGVLREMGAGLVGYIAGIPFILIGLMVSSYLEQFIPVTHPVGEKMMAGAVSPSDVLGMAALAVIFAPIIEELFFRGFLLHHLRQRWGMWFSVLATAFIFAAVHPQGIAGIPALMAIATVLGLIRCWRGSLIASMTAHAVHNGTLMVLLVTLVFM